MFAHSRVLDRNVHIVHGHTMLLRDWMIDRNIKDAELATLLGCERSYVTKLRRRQATPSLDVAAKIVAATGGRVSYDDLRGGIDRPAGLAEPASAVP
jgi:transcriptional regulator with XRE-family HTH domain